MLQPLSGCTDALYYYVLGCVSAVSASVAVSNAHLYQACLQEKHGQDGPVKPVSDRGLLGRKV